MFKALIILAALVATSLALNVPGIPTDFTQDNAVLFAISDDVARKFEKEYMKFLKSGHESPVLKQLSSQLSNAHSKKDIFVKEVTELGVVDEFVVCVTCRAVLNVLIRSLRDNDGATSGPENRDLAQRVTMDVCRRLNLQTEEVCAGLFESHYPVAEYILMNTVIDSREACGLFMQLSFCDIGTHPDYEWSLSVDNSAPAITGPKSDLPAKSDNDLTILQLTDIHHDPLYLPGSLAECAEPLCCQRHSDVAGTTSKAAGYWGDYRDCDLPWQTIDNALNHIKDTHKIDYIFQTGDVIDHMVWSTSVQKNTDVYTKVTDRIYEMFPGVPVYPTIGNHEPHPLNHFSPEDVPEAVNTKWLYEYLYNVWSKYLPADTKETILKGGYYTVLVKPGYRIISLNNNDCYTDNWWLFFNGSNMKTQLQWFQEILLQAEKNNEKVHVLAHIPSGDGTCWYVWAREYNRLLERFSATISGIFNGHSHKDEMSLHYSANGHAIAMSWNGGALTTFSDKNPNYRLYEVEPETMQVVDHETWIFNLTEANQAGEAENPKWFKEYTFSEEFTKDMSPAGIDKLLDQMASNPELVRKFWRFKMTMADPKLNSGCGKSCLMSTLCRIATTVNNQRDRCNELSAKLGAAIDSENPITTTTEGSTEETTENPIPSTTPKDDGAMSITAASLTTMIALIMCIKYLI